MAAENYQKELNNLKKEYAQLIKQIKEEKDEKEIKEKEKQAKIKRIKSSYLNKLNSIQTKKIYSIKETFDQNFCMDDIIKLDRNKITILINNSFKREKILDSVVFCLRTILKSFKNEIENITHLNILLVGATGVGKTTMINVLLKKDLNQTLEIPKLIK